jgi:hypothetical protein
MGTAICGDPSTGIMVCIGAFGERKFFTPSVKFSQSIRRLLTAFRISRIIRIAIFGKDSFASRSRRAELLDLEDDCATSLSLTDVRERFLQS